MRIIHRDLKEGKLKIKPENLDDLWYLKSIIEGNDLIFAKSYRRVRDETKARADKGERKPVFIGLRVEDVAFHRYSNRIRVLGRIEEGPEDVISLGAHHTVEIGPHDVITIVKEWRKWQLDRLKEAEKSAKVPLVLIAGIEEGEVEFAIIRRYGVDFITRIARSIPGKRVEKDHEVAIKGFYGEVVKQIEEILEKEEVNAVIICGPGFAKDNILALLKDKNLGVAKITYLEGTGTGGRVGIQEALKRGVVDRVIEESRVSYETRIVERLFKEIIKSNALATYGLKEVRKAIEYGAIKSLLISDKFLRKHKKADELIEKTKGIKGDVVIISTGHEAGERLESLGGIAALLRFAIS